MSDLELELLRRADVRDPKTWPRNSVLAEHYERLAVDAEWNGRQEEADRYYLVARCYRTKVENGDDLLVPF